MGERNGQWTFGGPRWQFTQRSWDNYVPSARSGRGGRVDFGTPGGGANGGLRTGTMTGVASRTPDARWGAQFQRKGWSGIDQPDSMADWSSATDTPDAVPAFGGVSDGMDGASPAAAHDDLSSRPMQREAMLAGAGQPPPEAGGVNNIAQIWPRKGEAMATGKPDNGWISTTPEQANDIGDTYASAGFSTKDLPY